MMTDAEEGESCRDIRVMEYHNETSGDSAAVSRQRKEEETASGESCEA